MNCADFETHLSEFIDGDLSSVIRKEFQKHTTNCPNCAELLLQVDTAVAALHNMPSRKVSPDFNTKLRARISQQQQRSFWKRLESFLPGSLFPKVAVTAVAASLLAVFTYNVFSDAPGSVTLPQHSVTPPPELNVKQPASNTMVIANEPVSMQSQKQASGTTVAETVDSNLTQPPEPRSYEGQIKYVNSE